MNPSNAKKITDHGNPEVTEFHTFYAKTAMALLLQAQLQQDDTFSFLFTHLTLLQQEPSLNE